MTRRKSVPAYRLHKNSNQAIVTLTDSSGRRRDCYLGPYGSPESRQEYTRRIQEWETTGQRLPVDGANGKSELTINELILAYWNWATARYVKDGKPTSELDTVRQALRFVRELYSATVARNSVRLR